MEPATQGKVVWRGKLKLWTGQVPSTPLAEAVEAARHYDSLHATVARRKGGKRIVTRNPSYFAHTAPDLEILTP